MSSQKAVVFQELGKPAVLVHDRPVPLPGPNQLQVKVKVAALNPHDQKTRDEGLFVGVFGKLPWICASDVVGTVSAIGPDAPDTYQVGDRVVFFSSFEAPDSLESGLQQFALKDIGGTVCKVPDGVSDDEAATLPTNLTSVLCAFNLVGIGMPWAKDDEGEVPESLLIVGGGSNCGRFAVQLAKLVGVKEIITIGGNEPELKALGATHVLDRHMDPAEIVQQVKQITHDSLLHVIDTVNLPEGLAPGFDALSSKKKGKLARLLPRDVMGEDVTKGHEIFDVIGGGSPRDPRSWAMWERLPSLIQEGKIKPTKFWVAGGLTAEVVNEALDTYRDGRSVGQPHIHVA